MLGTPIHFWVVFLTVTFASSGDGPRRFSSQTHKSGPGARSSARKRRLGIAVSLAVQFVDLLFAWTAVGVEFLTGYLVEKSLSVDNIFVFLLIFQSFHVPAESQHKVLFYGVLGALVMRAMFVLAGVELLQSFHAVLYVFGALLLLTGLKMFLPTKRVVRPDRNHWCG